MGCVYQIGFTHGTLSSNFPISLTSFEDFPIYSMFNSSNVTIELFAFTSNTHATDTNFVSLLHNKFRLFVKLFIDYRLNLEPFKPNTMDKNDISKNLPNIPIINFDSSKYMNSAIDSPQKDLLEYLDELAQGRLKTSIPNIVNWMDANVGKNSSGFCVLRNAYLHPDLRNVTKIELTKKFNDTVIFNPNGSIDRDAPENLKILESCIDPILLEIKSAFQKTYFSSEKLPHQTLLDVT